MRASIQWAGCEPQQAIFAQITVENTYGLGRRPWTRSPSRNLKSAAWTLHALPRYRFIHRQRLARRRSFNCVPPRAFVLSGYEHKYDDVRCAQFGLWQGARSAHPPKWGCNRRATTPQAKFGATLRAAVLFRPDFVARSSQIHFGICSSLAPRLAEKSLAANVIVFMFMTT